MYIIGLTGGIGSGKTAASDYLALSYNIEVVDADIVAREIVMQGQPALLAIAQHFGQKVLLADGQLNRAALREIVFNNPQERKILESITHPAIRERIQHKLRRASRFIRYWSLRYYLKVDNQHLHSAI
jgi:dephospho-CoA kinase